MEDGRVLAVSLGVSTAGLILLILMVLTKPPLPISTITPEDIGSRVHVTGTIKDLYRNPDGHVFFILSGEEDIKVVVFKDLAAKNDCFYSGKKIILRGSVEEYMGELEVIPSKAADIQC